MTTDGHLLGGRVVYRQPAGGFRSGIEPVLLAAAVPAQPGEHVLEAGTGCGAALLCLRARIPGVRATGVEIDIMMAGLAAQNVAANRFDGIEIQPGPIETVALGRVFDHAIANPPYHPADGSLSPNAARETAKRGGDAMLAEWIVRLGGALRDRGSLTLIVPAGMIPACLAAMGQSGCGCSTLFPLWPKAGRAAKLVLVRGVKRGRSAMRLMAGLTLHEEDGSFTAATQAVFRESAPLDLQG